MCINLILSCVLTDVRVNVFTSESPSPVMTSLKTFNCAEKTFNCYIRTQTLLYYHCCVLCVYLSCWKLFDYGAFLCSVSPVQIKIHVISQSFAIADGTSWLSYIFSLLKFTRDITIDKSTIFSRLICNRNIHSSKFK